MHQDNDKKGIDLSRALEDSGSSVKSEEPRVPSSYYTGTPKIIQWVIKYSGGLVKNEKQARYVLIGVMVLAIIISLFLIFSGGGTRQNTEPYRPNTKYGGQELPDTVR